MSRTLADFNRDDVSLYFRGTYVLHVPTGKVVYVRDIVEDSVYCNPVGYRGETMEFSCHDVRQWWPSNGVVNVENNNHWMAYFIARRAVRHSRRSASNDSLLCYYPETGGAGMQQAHMSPGGGKVVAELNDKNHYVETRFDAVMEYIRAREGLVLSVGIGQRLIYQPFSKDIPLRGRLFYGALGLTGTLNLETRKFQPLTTKSRAYIRAKRVIGALLES